MLHRLRRWEGRVWLASAYSFGVLLGCSFSARYVSPEHVWWLQLFGVAFPFLVSATLVLGIGALLRQQWVAAVLMGLVSTLGLVRYEEFRKEREVAVAETDRVAADEEHELRVGSFNTGSMRLLWETLPPSIERSETIYRALAPIVKEHGLDVLALQEATVMFDPESEQPQRVGTDAYIVGLLEENLVSAAFPRGGNRKVKTPILSSVPIGQATPVRLAQAGSVSNLGSRVVIHWQGQSVAVYSVHLRSYNASGRAGPLVWWRPGSWVNRLRTYKQDVIARSREAVHLRELLEAEAMPFVLGGDLNATPHSWVYHYLAQGGLQDTYGKTGRGWGKTFPASFPLVRIDYIFVSEKWTVDEAYVGKTVASDHRFVVAKLRLRTSPPFAK